MIRAFSSVTKIRAPQGVVWSVMTDHELYARWTSARRVHVEREGEPERNGAGAVRVFGTGVIKVREEVVEFEPPVRMVYRVASGMPLRAYRSEMSLEVDGPITVLTWLSRFEPRLPLTGGLLERVMQRAVDRFAEGIKDEAELRAAAQGKDLDGNRG